jgi:hypothetical protein
VLRPLRRRHLHHLHHLHRHRLHPHGIGIGTGFVLALLVPLVVADTAVLEINHERIAGVVQGICRAIG